MRHPTDAESAIVAAGPYLIVGLIAALPLLAVPSDWSLLAVVTIHLSAVVTFGLVLALRLAPAAAGTWFADRPWPEARRRFLGAAVLVALVTFVVGIVTLATGAALRLDPSMQFLQMLSALDIAWALTAIVVGLSLRSGRGKTIAGGLALNAVCVAALWNYLRVVGFGPNGEWIVNAGDLARLILPGDTLAAVVALVVLVWGVRGSGQPMEQESDQS